MERKIVELLLTGAGPNRISRELKVSKRRLIMVRAKAEEAGYLDGSRALPPYPEALFPDTVDARALKTSATWKELETHLPWIRERLEGGWHAVTVYEELPIKVPRSSFYRFLIRHRLNEKGRALRRVVPEIVHAPAEALLIDWGYLWTIERNGRKEKLWAFIGILGFSRFMVVRLMTSCTQTHTLAALSEMFSELGGVARRITSDNPKVFALHAHRHEPVIHPVYERFASHYGTTVECLPPNDPQKKGKVERPVSYVRRLLEGYSGDRNDVGGLQTYLTQKLVIANQRKHGTTHERPIDRFEKEERGVLKSLPVLAYELEEYHEGTVRIDGHVRFLGKYYSVSEDHIHHDVVIIGNSRQVSIFYKGKLIETHERLTDRMRSKSTKAHHLKPWEQVCANEEGLRGEARKIGPCVEQVVRRVLEKGDGFIDFRRIWGLLSLAKKYPHDEMDSACEEALLNNETSSKVVLRFILQAREEKTSTTPALQTLAPKGKFQRDIAEYSQILLNLNTGGNYEH